MINFRELMKNELVRRTEKNKKYGLRAYAQNLGLAPSHLCEVLKGRSGLSEKSARHVAFRLGLNPEEHERFVNLVRAEHGRSRQERDEARAMLLAGVGPTEPVIIPPMN